MYGRRGFSRGPSCSSGRRASGRTKTNVAGLIVRSALALALVGCGNGGAARAHPADDGGAAVELVPTSPAQNALRRVRAEFEAPREGTPFEKLLYPSTMHARFERIGDKIAVHRSDATAVLGLPLQADGEASVADARSGIAVQFHMLGANAHSGAAVSEDVAAYPNAAPGGGDVLRRTLRDGVEDFVVVARQLEEPQVSYQIDVGGTAGLRLVANTLEFMDASGTPRLRVAPPTMMDAQGRPIAVTLEVRGCDYDTNPAAPWGRPTVAPGADRCTMALRWHDDNHAYPMLLDPGWTTTGSTAAQHVWHAATRLKDGRVLVEGSQSQSSGASSELYDPGSGTWAATGALETPRYTHTASLLPNGKVVVAGGSQPLVAGAIAASEVYDPATGTWSYSGNCVSPRIEAVAAILPSGKPIVIGGAALVSNSYVPTAAAETYDLSTGTWSAVESMASARRELSVAVLADGRVLVAGGFATSETTPLLNAELFDESTGHWSAAGTMHNKRNRMSLTTLANGNALAVGGFYSSGGVLIEVATPELFSPSTNSWTQLPDMPSGRHKHAATLLPNGRVLVSGGAIWKTDPLGGNTESPVLGTLVFDPTTNNWMSAGSMVDGHVNGTATQLQDGRVLVMGGSFAPTSTEIFGLGTTGEACGSTAECDVACVDGVCCDSPCSQPCEACVASRTGGTDGVCAPVSAGTDPDGDCPDDGAASCGRTGACDGSGSCAFYPAGQTCQSPTCSNGQFTKATCNGGGSCIPASGTCAPYVCADAQKCSTSCVTDTDCSSGAHCVGGACVLQQANGHACTADDECTSTHCSDGVCCDSACNQICLSCLAADKASGPDGTCAPVKAGTDPADDCPDDGAASCQRDGLCDGTGACALYSTATVCAAPVCASGTLTTSTCNGAGNCVQANTSCGSYGCADAASCAVSCTVDADCLGGFRCSGGTCVVKSTNGTGCTDAGECQSGHCVDGVCCDSSCAETCEACDVPSHNGTCTVIATAPESGHGKCNGTGVCAGYCDGSSAACTYPGTGTACGSTCVGGQETVSACQNGQCVPGTPRPCSPFVCSSNGSCLLSCSGDTDCEPGYRCASGGCTPTGGAKCSNDNMTLIGADGTIECAPYLCNKTSGACYEVCRTSDECVSGYVCDTSTRTCKKSSNPKPSANGGCSCRAAGQKPEPFSGSWALFVVAGGILLQRRRSRRLRRRSS